MPRWLDLLSERAESLAGIMQVTIKAPGPRLPLSPLLSPSLCDPVAALARRHCPWRTRLVEVAHKGMHQECVGLLADTGTG